MSYRIRCTEVGLLEELLAQIVGRQAISIRMEDLWVAQEEMAFPTSTAAVEEPLDCKRTQEEGLAWVLELSHTNTQEVGSEVVE